MLSSTHRMFQARAPAVLAAAALCAAASGDPPAFRVTNLVSDGFVLARHIDPNLVNPSGIASEPIGVAWVANMGTGTSTLYDGNGMPQDLVVLMPGINGVPEYRVEPTGIAYCGGESFVVATNGILGRVCFLFATANGTITAWSPDVNPGRATTVVDSTAQGAVYGGLAVGADTTMGDVIYVTDIHNGRVRVFNNRYQEILFFNESFFDPDMLAGFVPFGIKVIDGTVYVTYAMQDDTREGGIVVGPRLGYVDAFDPTGKLLERIAGEGALNAPWGIARAPDDFGRFSGTLLIANFGDGRITAFTESPGVEFGQLPGLDGRPIEIEGLRGIAFGNGYYNQPTDTLFFAAGIGQGAHGLYGSISASACYADQDGDGKLDLFDFLTYVDAFNSADASADCNADGVLDLFDFLCFTNAFDAGC